MMNPDSRITRAAELAEEFAERRRRGERPTIDSYVRAYPELQSEIADMFPALLMLDDLCDIEPLSTMADGVPETIGDCRIVSEIGRGGMGVVYEAQQISMQRRVALKVLPRQVTGDSKTLQRFQLEAKSAGRLNHPNIVPVYEVAEHDGLWYYVMQFIPGLGLDQVVLQLRDSPGSNVFVPRRSMGPDTTVRADAGATDSECRGVLPGQSSVNLTQNDRRTYFHSVAEIGVQVAAALTCAHSAGIVHRDIKPSNLLLDAQGKVWVTDFGLVKTAGDSLTESGNFVGTIRYTAPERLKGTSDARSDIYGLGVTLYELLTLQPAFPGQDRVALIHQVANAEPVRPRALDSRIPRDLETIVLKAIHRDASHRYQTAEDFSADLSAFLQDKPIRARRSGGVELLRRWARRNRMLAAAVVVTGISMMAGTAVSTAMWLKASRRADDARLAQSKSEATLAMAGEAVERFFRLTSADSALPADLRRKLAAECLTYDERFVQMHNSSPASRSALAESHRRIGFLKWKYADPDRDAAAESFRREIAVLDLMLADSPKEHTLHVRRAGAFINIGGVEASRRRHSQAMQHYQQGIQILESLTARSELSDEYLANAVGNLALLDREAGRWKEGLTRHQREIELRQSLCAVQPGRIDARRRLATAYLHQANAQLDIGQFSEARQSCLMSIEAEPGPTSASESVPGLVGLRLEAAAAHAQLSLACLKLGRYSEALAASTRAVSVVGDIRERRPFQPMVHSHWGKLYAYTQHVHSIASFENGKTDDALRSARLAYQTAGAYRQAGTPHAREARYLAHYIRMQKGGTHSTRGDRAPDAGRRPMSSTEHRHSGNSRRTRPSPTSPGRGACRNPQAVRKTSAGRDQRSDQTALHAAPRTPRARGLPS